MVWRPLRSLLFPSTTLFRSIMMPTSAMNLARVAARCSALDASAGTAVPRYLHATQPDTALRARQTTVTTCSDTRLRSEEHTSELQSHSDLVCRLLLEKKKRD